TAEQVPATADTAPRAHNRRPWLSRSRPAAGHRPFELVSAERRIVAEFGDSDDVPRTPPNQLRWDPLPMPARPTECVDG
ncbi:homogentisate 1,2-dioxygenase, partial [Burkholderia pseudomallei]